MENNALKIRVVADTEEDIFIDFLALSTCNLLSIHELLIKSFNLNKLEIASFFLSNENWDKGEEITLLNMNINDEDTSKSMEDTSLESIHQNGINKLLYLHDFLNLNIFYIEFLEKDHIDSDLKINVVHKLGEYSPKVFNDVSTLTFDQEEDELSKIMNEDDEDDFGGFEELDEDLY
jgi:hypothetical protein